MHAIGKRIRYSREQKGLSQKEFAKRIGASNTTVSNWENGLSRPDVDTLGIICIVLDVSPDELLGINLPKGIYTTEEKLVITQYRSRPELQQAVRILLGIETNTNTNWQKE